MDLPNTRLWRAAPDGKLPSDRRPDHNQPASVLGSVKARPGNDGACGQARATADLDSPCARRPQHVWVGAKKRDSESNKATGMKEVESGVKYMLDLKRPIQGLLGVHSRYGLHTRAATVYRGSLSEGFSHFVTSIAAPVASGWSGCRVGFAPTGKRRLSTAHTHHGIRDEAARQSIKAMLEDQPLPLQGSA